MVSDGATKGLLSTDFPLFLILGFLDACKLRENKCYIFIICAHLIMLG